MKRVFASPTSYRGLLVDINSFTNLGQSGFVRSFLILTKNNI